MSSYEIRKRWYTTKKSFCDGSLEPPGGIRTRQPANYKSAALPLRHWGMNLMEVKDDLFFDVKSVDTSVQCEQD